MKRLVALTIVALLLLTGCDRKGGSSSSAESSSTPSSVEGGSSSGESSSSDGSSSGSSSQPDTRQQNSALARIPGAEKLGESAGAIFLLKEYGMQMGWMEANKIAHLERGTPPATGEVYFLLIPKFVGSEVKVEKLSWNGTDFVTAETLYTSQSTPDDYGLVLTSNEPEGGPNLQVTVTSGGTVARYQFSYDGKGDRPAIQLLPQE